MQVETFVESAWCQRLKPSYSAQLLNLDANCKLRRYMKVGAGTQPGVEVPPVISPAAKAGLSKP